MIAKRNKKVEEANSGKIASLEALRSSRGNLALGTASNQVVP
jgi:hypothetical protein